MERYAGALEEVADGARQQERHYQLLSALQSLVKELPSSFQQRLSYTTLSDLALALLDGTVFEIVQGLLEIQHLTEKSLYNQRLRLQNEHRGARGQRDEVPSPLGRRLPAALVLRQALRQKHQEAQQSSSALTTLSSPGKSSQEIPFLAWSCLDFIPFSSSPGSHGL
ncbi:protein DGCR6 [Trachypithecus francoisi]|uniref:protein DGCR6 n=1 Tax=Trachypithecus francoisi TaxID=54180 RepID=UPI00141BA1D8|nr:protein DGCR6 [Trachypithecus francoisi]